jgi:hypothetical protein
VSALLTVLQRNPTFETSHEFLSSSPELTLPLPVQFGHLSALSSATVSYLWALVFLAVGLLNRSWSQSQRTQEVSLGHGSRANLSNCVYIGFSLDSPSMATAISVTRVVLFRKMRACFYLI